MRHAFDVPGTSQDDPPPRRRARFRITLVDWLVIVGIISLVISLLLPFVDPGRCAIARSEDRLRQIGFFAADFAEQHGGAMPADFAALADAYPEMLPTMFVRPRGTVPAAGSLEQMLREPGHISFAWTGGGLEYPPPPEALLAYEVGFASYEEGTAVLLGDLSARTMRGDELRQLIQATQRRLDTPLPGLPIDPPNIGRHLTPAPPLTAASPE